MADKDLEKDIRLVLDGRAPLRELLEMDSNRMNLITEIAYLFFREGRLDEARLFFEGLYSIDPQNPYYCRALGAVAHRAGSMETALKYYQHALRLDESDPLTWANAAEVLMVLGDRAQAEAHFERAESAFKKRAPDSPYRKRAQALRRKR